MRKQIDEKSLIELLRNKTLNDNFKLHCHVYWPVDKDSETHFNEYECFLPARAKQFRFTDSEKVERIVKEAKYFLLTINY